jgi:hypothetical protein
VHHHHHPHPPFHHGVPTPYPSLYKRSVGECYYTPPQPDYYQRPHFHVHLPQRHFWQEPPVDYARTLGRTRREAPVSAKPAGNATTKPEMSKLKRLMFARAANAGGNGGGTAASKDELKMCTWSPYTSYEMPDYRYRFCET